MRRRVSFGLFRLKLLVDGRKLLGICIKIKKYRANNINNFCSPGVDSSVYHVVDFIVQVYGILV